ncbi:hypothetical protein WA026_021720 [Henosepilachna vigintioctopunctata]|uniref:Uncharacterized protein n=1 Tax=Henosepilachna vigintioctopunctata TaxID=420089 RepID=A0AAW1TXT0_9CUCU
MLIFDANKTNNANKPQAFCIFEYVYFTKPNSIFEGQEVYEVRLECGRQLAKEWSIEADVVGSVPESGNAAAHGYSQQMVRISPGLPVINKTHERGITLAGNNKI